MKGRRLMLNIGPTCVHVHSSSSLREGTRKLAVVLDTVIVYRACAGVLFQVNFAIKAPKAFPWSLFSIPLHLMHIFLTLQKTSLVKPGVGLTAARTTLWVKIPICVRDAKGHS